MPDLPPPVYRPMTADDMQVAAYVRKAALQWLARDLGREPPEWRPFLAGHHGHIRDTDPAGSWAAEIGGLVVGYSQAFLRGDIWFLAQLFVVPEVHGMGVGRELLRLATEYGRERNARIFSVVASPSPVAQALYMRAGMFSRGNLYSVTGTSEALVAALPAPDANRKRVVDCSGWMDQIAALDREVWGAERRADHEFYLRPSAVPRHSFALTREGVLDGYGYVDERGWIGPIVAREPEGQLPLLRMAAEWLVEHNVPEAQTGALSVNAVMMGALLGAGWKFERWTYFLSSELFGKLDRYHPSGGLLL